MTPEIAALLNYGVLGVVVLLLLTGMLVTKGHLETVRGFADRAMNMSDRQIDATNRLAAMVERAVEELRRASVDVGRRA